MLGVPPVPLSGVMSAEFGSEPEVAVVFTVTMSLRESLGASEEIVHATDWPLCVQSSEQDTKATPSGSSSLMSMPVQVCPPWLKTLM